MPSTVGPLCRRAALLPGGIALFVCLAMAQRPVPDSAAILSLTATTAGVVGAPDSIRIDVLRWSTDAEREQLMAAWNMTGAERGGRGGSSGGSAAAGRGAGRGRGGRGVAAPADDPAPDPDAVQDPFGTFGLRGGRGGRGGGEDAPARPTPEGAFAIALRQATTLGYLWSSEVAGYALRYAGNVSGPNGVDRIILITDRRLGKTNDLWTGSGPGTPTTYDFSVMELRVNAKGEGEGKVSLTGKVAPDSTAKIVALEDYGSLPVVLRNVKRRATDGTGK
jgi:hypothetical protein